MLRVPIAAAYILSAATAAVPAGSRPSPPAAQPAAARRPTDAEMGWLVPGLSGAGNSFILAWNRHDAAALAALWHADGDFVDAAGRTARGRGEIAALFEDELGASRLDFLSAPAESAAGKDTRTEDWDVEIAGAPPSMGLAKPARLHLFFVYSRRLPTHPPADSMADSAAGSLPFRPAEPPPDPPPDTPPDHPDLRPAGRASATDPAAGAAPSGGWLLASVRAYALRGRGRMETMTEGAEPYSLDGTVTPPRPLSTPPPVYTEAARRARIEGVVRLDAVVGRDGRVAVGRVLAPLPFGLTAKAREAALRWRFRPATLHGRPVAVHQILSVRFVPPAPAAEASP